MLNSSFTKGTLMSGRLSEREKKTIELAAQGLVDKEIADHMAVRLATIRTYWERAKEKLGAKTRTHAACCALVKGMIKPDLSECRNMKSQPAPEP